MSDGKPTTVKKAKRRPQPAIYCMEGDWSRSSSDLRTVRPVLEALAAGGQVRSVWKHLSAPADLRHQLEQWALPHNDRYTIGYVGLHGSPRTVYVGGQGVGFDEIAGWVPDSLGGKVMHFGSCEVLADSSRAKLEEFRTAVGARALTGFTQTVGWYESMALELLLLDALTYYSVRIDKVEPYLKDVAGTLVKQTGFRMIR